MASERLKRYFDFSSVDKNRICGHCKLCDQKYKDKNGIFSNFLKHLKRKHLSQYELHFLKQDEGFSEKGSIASNDQSTTESSTNTYKQYRINKAIGKYLIIKCNLPLSLVENNAFRDFMKECNIKWNPTSAKYLKRHTIAKFTEQANKTIRETLGAIDYLTLTVGGWSDRKCRSFLGITCHFINFKMQPASYLIDFVRLKSPHTGENIHQATECIIDRFNVKEKVYKIVTDNVSSMMKAYKFGLTGDDESNDNDREINLISNGNTALNEYDEDIDTNSFQFIDIQHYDDDIIGYDECQDVRLSCFAHTLQLSIRDGLKKCSLCT
ncbi:unnamed protein product [Rotaria socialis]|uniref:BED-type domain-containing protein n=1 Tax=Rotaria socialis TaxID=392032 RepID=A0A818HGJ6_9BILA|nr:unnamed protein product [Rotaria socialis]